MISAMPIWCPVAYTHCDITTKENEKLVEGMTNIHENLSKGFKLFFKMIKECHNYKPIVPIIPAMCYSTIILLVIKTKGMTIVGKVYSG